MTKTNSTLYTTTFNTAIGEMIALSFENKLIFLSPNRNLLVENRLKEFEKKLNVNRVLDDNCKIFIILRKQLDEYFSKKRKEFTIALKFYGSDFEIKAWETLQKIPYGKTISYKEQATLLGNEKAFRAVANANGKNDISVIVPCHRVILKNGKLGGYTGGTNIKEFLLNLEKENSELNSTSNKNNK